MSCDSFNKTSICRSCKDSDLILLEIQSLSQDFATTKTLSMWLCLLFQDITTNFITTKPATLIYVHSRLKIFLTATHPAQDIAQHQVSHDTLSRRIVLF